MEFLQQQFWNNFGKDYLIALGVFLGTWLIFYLFTRIIIARLKKISKKTDTDVDDFLISLITRLRPPFYFFITLYIASQFLILPAIVGKILFALFILIIVLEAILTLQKVIDYVIRKKLVAPGEDNKDKEAIIKLSGNIIKGIVWALGVLMVLSNLGIDVTSLITGLGIGGIAVALALQNILSDMFASFSIFTDKPFKVGDFIIVGSDMGTVQKIGIKSTRFKTLEGQELVIPNKTLTEERINNYGRMQKRRVVFSLGVIYDTDIEKLKKIPALTEEIIKSQKETEFSRMHFKKYGESSLDFEGVYFINNADYGKYMDIQQNVNLEIFNKFKQEGIEFAFPSRTIYLEKN